MTTRFQLFFISCLLFVFLGCSSDQASKFSDGVKVTIPISKSGSYEFQTVRLETVSNLNPLEGLAARFFLRPQISTEGTLIGASPKTSYRTGASGDIIASQVSTLQYFTIYYHFERLRDFDRKLNVDSLNSWPRKTVVDVPMESSNSSRGSQNAMYIPSLDAYIFYRNESRSWPLAMNAGVIAHEHFHSLFSKLVKANKWSNSTPGGLSLHQDSRFSKNTISQNKELSSKDLYMIYLLRGLNEGFADFWGYLYSEDVNFVSRSIPGERGRSVESSKLMPFVTQVEYMAQVEQAKLDQRANVGKVGAQLLVGSYQLGTQLSQTLTYFLKVYFADQKIKDTYSEDQQKKVLMGSQVIEAVKKLNEAVLIAESKTEALVNPSFAVYAFFKSLPDKPLRLCEELNAFLKDSQENLSYNPADGSGVLVNGGSDVCK